MLFAAFSYCSTDNAFYPGEKWVHLSGRNIGDIFFVDVDCCLSWPRLEKKKRTVAYTLFAIDNKLYIICCNNFTIGIYKKKD